MKEGNKIKVISSCSENTAFRRSRREHEENIKQLISMPKMTNEVEIHFVKCHVSMRWRHDRTVESQIFRED